MIEIITPKGKAYVDLDPSATYFNGKQFLPPNRLDYLFIRQVPQSVDIKDYLAIMEVNKGLLCKVNGFVSSMEVPATTLPWVEDGHLHVCACTKLRKLSFIKVEVINE